MSVVAQPLFITKRHFDESDSSSCEMMYCAFKKQRLSSGMAPCSANAQNVYMSKDLNTLMNVFIDFDDKVVRDTFFESLYNIDVATKRLMDMRLLRLEQESKVAEEIISNSVSPECLENGHDEDRKTDVKPEIEESNSGAIPTPESHEIASTATEWADILVQEMSAATNLADARSKAAAILERFESCMVFSLKAQAISEAEASVRPRLTELTNENRILKKAVQIQHRQTAELRQAAAAAAATSNAEIRSLFGQLDQSREKIRSLDLANYSLTVHLERATNGGVMSLPYVHPRNPDVY
uniref:Uncharacterized protein n=1 Tax=Polytomella parva TaxID=51329 RepID=A0A6U0ZAX3_9CHLO|mmetsp:Transcript_8376/g.16108  ORF Transcript_8376/g.16108 Transcript_8376/m.16108 type:complete len:297 (+) Transcript_8376:121-1011(+)